MMLPQSRLSRLTLASLAVLLASTSAIADPVLVSVSGASAGSSTASPADYSTTGYKSSYSTVANSMGQGNGSSFANAGGAYAVRASATGKATGSSLASFTNSFTNTSGVAQHYSLSFHIYGGSISTYVNDPMGLTGLETLISGYKASVKTTIAGGPQVTNFSSSATLTRTATATEVETGGTALLNAGLSGDYYGWSNGYYNVDLGVVAAGASFDVVAEVENMAFADVGTYSFGSGGRDYGGYECYFPTQEPSGRSGAASTQAASSECSAFKGTAGSFYGDPLHLDGGPFAAVNADGAGNLALTVPEPANLALVGAGLAAALAARRRRRNN
jgi:hypothetical protein